MNDNNMPSLRERLMQLPAAELDEMLHAELRKEAPDENAVKLILGILEDREKDIPVEMDARTEAAWERYQRRIARTPARPKRGARWLQRYAAVSSAAVIALILFVGSPQRAEALEFFREMVSGWKNDILEIFSPGETVSEVERTFETDHAGMQLIYDTAVEMGIEDPLIPMWFEDGFEITTYETISTPTKNRIHCLLAAEGKKATFNVDIYSDEVGHGYCGDDTVYKSFEREGATYEITQNYEKWVVIWKKDNIEYFLTIDCQEDILDTILASIYVMEDMK